MNGSFGGGDVAGRGWTVRRAHPRHLPDRPGRTRGLPERRTLRGVTPHQQPVTVVASRSTARRVRSVELTRLSRNENALSRPSAPRARPLSAMTPLRDPVLASMSPAAHRVGAVT